MNSTEITGYIAIAVIVVSVFFIGANMTGFVVTENATGVVNVTITGAGVLNFSTALLDFGAGYVLAGVPARLQSNGTGLNTSWSAAPITGELVLQNIGNVDLNVTLQTNKTAAQFIGGTLQTPAFRAIVANSSGNTSCVAANFSSAANVFQDINLTAQYACTPLTHGTSNSVDIDFELYIPSDATGAKTVGIIAIGTY